MKKLLALLTLCLVIFVVINRERIFMWDPIASVTRDGAKQSNVRVMINYSNDILVDDRSTPTRRIFLVQNYNDLAATPTAPLKCIQYLACLTDADHASAQPLPNATRTPRATMTNKQIQFTDDTGSAVTVTLR